jgi:hypothetical protein
LYVFWNLRRNPVTQYKQATGLVMLPQVNQILLDAPLICTTKFMQGERYIISVFNYPGFYGGSYGWGDRVTASG